jgi:hypothetical protein
MNEQLQKELAAWLSKLREAADTGGSFVLDQAPAIVQEKIAYGRATETLWCVVGVLLLLLAYWFSKRAMRWFDEMEGNPFGFIGAGVFAFFGVILTLIHVDAALKVWFAPRLYVIEWLSELLK